MALKAMTTMVRDYFFTMYSFYSSIFHFQLFQI